MITKSILAFMLLFMLYSGILLLKPELTNYSQDQEVTNLMNAQQYIYNNQKYQAVIVGSSLSTRLIISDLPGYNNLAFGGLSSLDGLNIIKHSDVLPDHIFIETNELVRPASKTFNKQIFDPIPFYIKKYLIALRDSKKPLGFTELVMVVGIEKVVPKFFKSDYAVPEITIPTAVVEPVEDNEVTKQPIPTPVAEPVQDSALIEQPIPTPILDVQGEDYAKEPDM